MTRPQLVLFDCDGVVVDSERLTNLMIRNDLAERGWDQTLEQAMDTFMGGTMADVETKARDYGLDMPGDWISQIYERIYEALKNEVELVPGIEAVLDRLDATGIPFAMGSNGSIEKMHITLGRTGILHRFEGRLYSGQDMDAGKPAPDVYLHAARQAGISPVHSVVVEDSRPGAMAAKAAGMKCFGFTHDTAEEKLRDVADVLFDDMADLPSLMGL